MCTSSPRVRVRVCNTLQYMSLHACMLHKVESCQKPLRRLEFIFTAYESCSMSLGHLQSTSELPHCFFPIMPGLLTGTRHAESFSKVSRYRFPG